MKCITETLNPCPEDETHHRDVESLSLVPKPPSASPPDFDPARLLRLSLSAAPCDDPPPFPFRSLVPPSLHAPHDERAHGKAKRRKGRRPARASVPTFASALPRPPRPLPRGVVVLPFSVGVRQGRGVSGGLCGGRKRGPVLFPPASVLSARCPLRRGVASCGGVRPCGPGPARDSPRQGRAALATRRTPEGPAKGAKKKKKEEKDDWSKQEIPSRF